MQCHRGSNQPTATARAVRAIGNDQRPNAKPVDARHRPEVGTGEEGDLLVERHRIQQGFDVGVGHVLTPRNWRLRAQTGPG
jgi:hypothetical protein